MNATTSTAAWALHDLGLATSLGGAVFGRMALQPAVNHISNRREHKEVLDVAWKRFSALNLLSHVAFASTWWIGRRRLSGREVGRRARGLVLVKDALVASSLITGVASIIAGRQASRREDIDASPATIEGINATLTEPRGRRARQISRRTGVANIFALAGVVGVTTVLAMSAGRSSKWALRSRLLP